MRKITFIGSLLALMLSTQALAADILDVGSTAVQNEEMSKEVVVTATKSEKNKLDVPASITVITAEDIQKTKAKSIYDIVNKIPGIFANSRNYSDDVRIVIRGVGNRALSYGIRGILVLLDGVPVSDIDVHKSDLVDVNSVERVEVIRGPYSTIYGSQAMGGVINIITKKGKLLDKDEKKIRIGYGSYNAQQYIFSDMGKLNNNSSYYIFGGRQSSDGYRDQNKWGDSRFFTKEDFGIDDTSNMTVMYSYSYSLLQLPGELTLAQFNANPQQANATNIAKNYQRNQIKSRFSTAYTKDFSDDNNLMVNLFYQDLILDHPIFQYIDNYTNGVGADVKWSVGTNLFGVKNTWVTGLNAETNKADLRNWVNSSTQSGTMKGALVTYNKLDTSKFGIFLQDEIQLSAPMILILGARTDNIGYVNTIASTGAATSYNANKISPKVALNYRLSDTSSVFANYSTGFNAPTYSEAAAPNPPGSILLPEEATSYEIGFNGMIGNLNTSLSLYNMDSINEIMTIPPAIPGGITTYGNIGQTNHKGVEVSLSYPIADMWSVGANYTIGSNTFVNYQTFNGKTLVGVPDNMLNGELKYNPQGTGFNASIGFINMGPHFIDNANTLTCDGYTVYNFRLGYKQSKDLEYWLVGDNVFNAKYATLAYMSGATALYMPGNGVGYTFGANYTF
jgi:iron complex outermembrane receptor protein